MIAASGRSGTVAACRAGDGNQEGREEIGVDLGAELRWQCREIRGDSRDAVMVRSGKGHRSGC